MVPHVATHKTHQRLQEFSFDTPKRLLQQYRHFSDTADRADHVVLQKSFWGGERNFLGPLMRFVRRGVRDLIAHQKNGH